MLPQELHPLASDPARAVFVECLAASVCHATNWDRLRGYLIRQAAEVERFNPTHLAQLTIEIFRRDYGTAFNPDVVDIDRRYEIFRTVAEFFAHTNTLDGRILASGVQQLAGPQGIYKRLDQLEPFRADPHRKKARVFVQQLLRFGFIKVDDPQELQPAIEHHLIRLYLRTGRVTHPNGIVPGSTTAEPTDLDTLTTLRSAVGKAMRHTAAAACLPIATVNEIEWQIARSYCDRDAPRCNGPAREDKPVLKEISSIGGHGCPYASICAGAQNESLARLNEPQLAASHAFY